MVHVSLTLNEKLILRKMDVLSTCNPVTRE